MHRPLGWKPELYNELYPRESLGTGQDLALLFTRVIRGL